MSHIFLKSLSRKGAKTQRKKINVCYPASPEAGFYFSSKGAKKK
jgi:hypothetical protein